jgi:hypothetical protein
MSEDEIILKFEDDSLVIEIPKSLWKDLYLDKRSLYLYKKEEYKDKVKYDNNKYSINISRTDILKRFSLDFRWKHKDGDMWKKSENIEYSLAIRKYKKILKSSIFLPEIWNIIFQYHIPIIKDGYEQHQYEENLKDRPFNESDYYDPRNIIYKPTDSSDEESSDEESSDEESSDEESSDKE